MFSEIIFLLLIFMKSFQPKKPARWKLYESNLVNLAFSVQDVGQLKLILTAVFHKTFDKVSFFLMKNEASQFHPVVGSGNA